MGRLFTIVGAVTRAMWFLFWTDRRTYKMDDKDLGQVSHYCPFIKSMMTVLVHPCSLVGISGTSFIVGLGLTSDDGRLESNQAFVLLLYSVSGLALREFWEFIAHVSGLVICSRWNAVWSLILTSCLKPHRRGKVSRMYYDTVSFVVPISISESDEGYLIFKRSTILSFWFRPRLVQTSLFLIVAEHRAGPSRLKIPIQVIMTGELLPRQNRFWDTVIGLTSGSTS